MGNFLLLLFVGFLAGVSSGLLGIGGGVILVPALVFFLGLGIHQAIGISLAIIIPTACAGVLKHFMAGNVDLRIALIVAVFAIAGGYLGASVATSLPARTLKKVFGVFLVGMGIHFLVGTSGTRPSDSAGGLEMDGGQSNQELLE